MLLAGSEDATAWMWKLPEGTVMQIFSAHSASVSYGTFANKGQSIATASEDGSVRLWNPRAGMVEHCFDARHKHDDEKTSITCLAANDHHPVIMFGATDGALRLAHCESGKILSKLMAHDQSVESSAFCDCMELGASAGMDGRLCVWDLNTFALRHTCSHPAGVVEIQWRKGSPLLFACTVSKELRLWDARNGTCLKTLTGHADVVLCLAVGYPAAGTYALTGSDDATARVWALSDV